MSKRNSLSSIASMRKGLAIAALFISAVVLLASATSNEAPRVESAVRSNASPLYRSSIVGTDFDFITENDPDTFERLDYVGFMAWVMRDKRISESWVPVRAYVFNAFFTDGTKLQIALHSDFGSKEAAEADSLRYTPRLGKLPTLYRRNIKHLNVHKGGPDTTAHTKSEEHIITIYSENATKRISTHDLEETFFHEASHAIQDAYLGGAAWKNAKALDNAYITEYAKRNDQEDFAESALFAYTIIYHPERFPAADRTKIEKQIPNRIAFFRYVFAGRTPSPTSSPPSASSNRP